MFSYTQVSGVNNNTGLSCFSLQDMKRFESPRLSNEKPMKVMDLNENTIYTDKMEDGAESPRTARATLKLNLSNSSPNSALGSPGTNRRLSGNDYKMDIGGLSPRPSELITRSSSPRLSEINAIINGSHVKADDAPKNGEKDDRDVNGGNVLSAENTIPDHNFLSSISSPPFSFKYCCLTAFDGHVLTEINGKQK